MKFIDQSIQVLFLLEVNKKYFNVFL